jgi:hypothetical protein
MAATSEARLQRRLRPQTKTTGYTEGGATMSFENAQQKIRWNDHRADDQEGPGKTGSARPLTNDRGPSSPELGAAALKTIGTAPRSAGTTADTRLHDQDPVEH